MTICKISIPKEGTLWYSDEKHCEMEGKTMLRYIFVHGLAGWGSYDEKYQEKPYWGM